MIYTVKDSEKVCLLFSIIPDMVLKRKVDQMTITQVDCSFVERGDGKVKMKPANYSVVTQLGEEEFRQLQKVWEIDEEYSDDTDKAGA